MPTNTHLNRYNNVLAYDHTRVVIEPNRVSRRNLTAFLQRLWLRCACLHVRQENFNNDYINANWIKGQFSDKTYIATQGPVPTSFTRSGQCLAVQGAQFSFPLSVPFSPFFHPSCSAAFGR